MKRVAIYARVSTDKQTCENQLIELRAVAERCGYTIVTEFVDTGISGALDFSLIALLPTFGSCYFK